MARGTYLKRLGQHHLVSGSLCRPLVEYLRPAEGAQVLEIGPGGGVLTRELLAAGARVLAVELDPAWAVPLARDLTGKPFTVAVADALDLAWDRLASPTLVAGNLPYNVATALIQRLLPHHPWIPRAAFLVQKEVAERLVASPGSKAYGALSVLVGVQAEARILGRVRPGSFRPPPKVDSAFVGFTLKPPPFPAEQLGAFTRLVFAAFGQRRKTLRNALTTAWGRERAEDTLKAANIDPGLRAEQLELAQLLALHEVVNARP